MAFQIYEYMELWTIFCTVCVLCVVLYLLRKYFSGGTCRSSIRLEGKVVVITGANAGIGKETAIDLAKRGATVVMACRDMKKGEKALREVKEGSGNVNIYLKQLNLASLKSIREFVSSFLEEFPNLSILINNAGVMHCPYSLTEDGYEMQFGVNHLGHFALTNLLLKQIVDSGPSRIVNVSSMTHFEWMGGAIRFADINSKKRYGRQAAYAQSKLANVLFTKELNKRLSGTSTSTYALHPGVVASELGRYYRLIYKIFYFVGKLLIKTPKQGAQTSIYCAVAEGIEGYSGMYFSDCRVTKSSKTSMDEGIAKKLWELSEQMTKIKCPI